MTQKQQTLTENPSAPPVPPAIQLLRVPVRVDFALRALVAIDAAGGRPAKLRDIAEAEGLPRSFLSTILIDLRNAGLLCSMRGSTGGYWLARPADEITVAEVYATVDLRAPMATPGSTVSAALWNLLEAQIRRVLAEMTVADVRHLDSAGPRPVPWAVE